MWTGTEKPRDLRRGGQHPFDIVQDEQDAPLCKHGGERVAEPLAESLAHAERGGDGGDDEIRIDQRRQVDKDHAVRTVLVQQ